MKIIRHPKRKSLKRCVVALGTFDGVHFGHQKVIKALVSAAKKTKASSIAVTFDPHPQAIIAPQRGLKLLTTLPDREKLLADLGIDGVVVFRFSKHLKSLSYDKFVKRYLVDKLGVKHVFVGYDYAFGKKRAGDVAALKHLGKKYGFLVTVVPLVKIAGHLIKSSVIRELMSCGDFSQAIRLLGHPYSISGRVVRGAGRGKALGFPTANLKVNPKKLIPAHGVYAGRVDGKKCVVNIGARPTFGADQTVVEVHILGSNKNIRGKRLEVLLSKRLRDEFQFSDVEKLKRQIQKDVDHVRRFG